MHILVTSFCDHTIRSCLSISAYIENKLFVGLALPPFSLNNGDLMQHIRDLKAAARPIDPQSAHVWALCQTQTVDDVACIVRLCSNLPCTINIGEQHHPALTGMKKGPSEGRGGTVNDTVPLQALEATVRTTDRLGHGKTAQQDEAIEENAASQGIWQRNVPCRYDAVERPCMFWRPCRCH